MMAVIIAISTVRSGWRAPMMPWVRTGRPQWRRNTTPLGKNSSQWRGSLHSDRLHQPSRTPDGLPFIGVSPSCYFWRGPSCGGRGFEALRATEVRVMGRCRSGWRDALTRVSTIRFGLWDLGSGEVRWLEATRRSETVAYLPGGRAVSGGDDSTLRLWNLASGESRRLEGHTARSRPSRSPRRPV